MLNINPFMPAGSSVFSSIIFLNAEISTDFVFSKQKSNRDCAQRKHFIALKKTISKQKNISALLSNGVLDNVPELKKNITL